MSVRDVLKIRKALLAGGVALTLTGMGVAVAWSADPPSPSPSQSAPGQENRPAKPDKSQRPQHLHSEGVVKKADGTFQTVLEQRGTVESVTGTSITVKSEDGYSRTFTVNAETKIRQAPAARRDSSKKDDGGQRHKPADGTIADITAGDSVRVSGVKEGDLAIAERIVEGAGDGPGFGPGRGQGHEKGPHGGQRGHGAGPSK